MSFSLIVNTKTAVISQNKHFKMYTYAYTAHNSVFSSENFFIFEQAALVTTSVLTEIDDTHGGGSFFPPSTHMTLLP